jgi:hypothetical protein
MRAQKPRAEKLVRVAEGGKLHRRRGKTYFPRELQTNTQARETGAMSPPPACLERGKLVAVAQHRRTLSTQSLQG